MIGVVIAVLLVVAALAIFGIACVYAAWEDHIDRRRRQRLYVRSVWDETKRPPSNDNLARGQEIAG